MWTVSLLGHSSRNTAVWTEGERGGAKGRQAEGLSEPTGLAHRALLYVMCY